MKKLKELYQQSLQELCHTKTVVLCGTLSCTRHRLKYGRKHPARSLHQDRLFRAAKPHR